ncbi:MAG: 50S ribosome-binding GTPase [Magnetococcales bacterium]|nr:50S ribosome-binding GTPase [Magnetococcales bacterium]
MIFSSKHGSWLKTLLTLAVVLAVVLILYFLLQASELAFAVWDRLQAAPEWLLWSYLGIVLTLLIGAGWLIWRIRTPRPDKGGDRKETQEQEHGPNRPPDEALIEEKIEENIQAGADVHAAKEELEELRTRREAGEVHVTMFGDVSAGKSTLIAALLPGAEVETGPVGGTTRMMHRHSLTTPGGDTLILTDLPGLNEARSGDDERADEVAARVRAAREEAVRAHAVVYVCEGDLTRDQLGDLEVLTGLAKPLVLAANKSDRYTDGDMETVRERLKERLATLPGSGPDAQVVAVSGGGEREVFILTPEGEERREIRPIPPKVEALAQALQRIVDRDPALLDALRDGAVFALASSKLDEALIQRRRDKGNALIDDYAHKAVLGAMAAVTPGLDLIVQGVLGAALVRALCKLHGVSVRTLEIEQLLKKTDMRAGKAIPLVLAVVGNVLKAFPGAGTVAGGVLHAVCYGLIFETLGRAVARTLEERGNLEVNPVLRRFEEKLSDRIEARSKYYIRMALDAAMKRPGKESAREGTSTKEERHVKDGGRKVSGGVP